MRGRLLRWFFYCFLALIPAAWLTLFSVQVYTGLDGRRHYLGQAGVLTSWEDQIHDWLYRWRGDIESPLQVIYVDVDSQSIADLGNFPWDRGWFGMVSGALVEAGGVSAVGLDFVFSSKGQPELLRDRLVAGNLAFSQVLSRTDRIVLAASYTSAVFRDEDGSLVVHEAPLLYLGEDAFEIEPPELPELSLSAVSESAGEIFRPLHVGLIDTFGGGVRLVPAFAPTADGGRPIFHLSVELAARALGVGSEGLSIQDDAIVFAKPDGELVRRVPLMRGQLLEVNWFSGWDAPQNLRASFSDVLQYAAFLESDLEEERLAAREFFEQFRGAVVLIGPVDPFLQDIATTPMDSVPVPRVGIHGNLVKTLVSGELIERPPTWVTYAITLGLTLLLTWMATADGRHSRALKISGLLVVCAYAVAAVLLFSEASLLLPTVTPLGAAFTTSFAAALGQLVHEQQMKGRIRSMFSTYAPEQIVDQLIRSGETPRLGGVQAEITAYFSDIQGFSTIAEELPPERLVELMNEYLTTCTDAVYEELGLLDKYVGDALIAMFGGLLSVPDHARRGCAAALLVQRRQRELCQRWSVDGRGWTDRVLSMRTRIGLHSGPAIVGNMGSKQRFTYTMMGDTVNLASRLEGACKHLGVFILVSETVRQQVEAAGGGFVFRRLDCVEVVGRAEPIEIHELVCKTEDFGREAATCLELFERAHGHYRRQEWELAEQLFLQAEPHEPLRPGRDAGVAKNPSQVFARRCVMLRKQPPGPDWDGVFRFTEK